MREYVPPPMRCYKCQRYGHIATFFKGKQRCGKCGGDHEYDKCESDVKKCSNCGGGHTAAYGGCPVRKRAVVVQQVRAEKKITYAQAIKVVDTENKERETTKPVNKECEGISTEKLVLFIAYVKKTVLNKSAQREIRSR